eukprot:15063684-Ditylum_brightwellii.AAC.1
MDFMHIHSNGCLQFFAGNMQPCVDSDAVSQVMSGAKSHIAGSFYLVTNPHLLNYNKAPNTGPFHTECKVLKHDVCSAAEAETAKLFHNCEAAIVLCKILNAQGHQQKATCTKTDNRTTHSFAHAMVRVKQSKSFGMRFY